MDTNQAPTPQVPQIPIPMSLDQFVSLMLQPSLRPVYEALQGMSRRMEALEQRVMQMEQRPAGDGDQAVSDFLASDRLDSAVRGVIQRDLDGGELGEAVRQVANEKMDAYLRADWVDTAIKNKFGEMLEDGELDDAIKAVKIQRLIEETLESSTFTLSAN